MRDVNPDTTGKWRKSSRSSGQNGDCVEVNPEVGVRDSKNPDAVLIIGWDRFQHVVTAIQAGQLDR
ncbi:DUF397 domain-containing protein [Kibdelosporangium philippinense]|uniref:DUF397 domain-containing protein n=1 Tax=Kibdelosporangium philippinense TaxID=211113 RepID=A0ABS8ZGG2_9PSEU|nr:DUF397 domain-containing protein [Kibdelosporangium philippinense]MCE7006915.1 DUF397 domain-containing protein [Kibdelosporangium philippinense]